MSVIHVQQRNSRRNIQLDDLFLREVVEPHDNGAKAVAMSSNKDVFPCSDVRQDPGFEIWQRTRGGIFQTLTDAERIELRHIARWRHIIAPSPQLYLLIAVLLCRLRLVQTLQCTVVPFIQRFVVLDRQMLLPDDLQHDLQRIDGALQDRSTISAFRQLRVPLARP